MVRFLVASFAVLFAAPGESINIFDFLPTYSHKRRIS